MVLITFVSVMGLAVERLISRPLPPELGGASPFAHILIMGGASMTALYLLRHIRADLNGHHARARIRRPGRRRGAGSGAARRVGRGGQRHPRWGPRAAPCDGRGHTQPPGSASRRPAGPTRRGSWGRRRTVSLRCPSSPAAPRIGPVMPPLTRPWVIRVRSPHSFRVAVAAVMPDRRPRCDHSSRAYPARMPVTRRAAPNPRFWPRRQHQHPRRARPATIPAITSAPAYRPAGGGTDAASEAAPVDHGGGDLPLLQPPAEVPQTSLPPDDPASKKRYRRFHHRPRRGRLGSSNSRPRRSVDLTHRTAPRL